MDILVSNYELYSKGLVLSSFATCIYLPGILMWLNFKNSLYGIGNYQKTYLHWILIAAEITKYLIFLRYIKKHSKKHETKKFKYQSLFKSVLVLSCVTFGFYIVAVLFGAPFFSKQRETFTFAIIMTALTALPCCFHVGPNSFIALLLSITSFDANDLQKKFLILIQLTCLGSWLGSVVIPLDWNKPYQVWPFPCLFGALLGYFLGNLLVIVSYVLEKRSKKKSFKV